MWIARPPAAGWKTAGVYGEGASIQSQLPKLPKFEFRALVNKEVVKLPLEKNSAGVKVGSYLFGRVYGEDPQKHGSMVDTGATWQFAFGVGTLSISWSKHTCEKGPTHPAWRAECDAQCKLAAALCKPARPIPEPIKISGIVYQVKSHHSHAAYIEWPHGKNFSFFDNGGSENSGWLKYKEE